MPAPGETRAARGLVLFGPPAAGKDTVTAALIRHDPAYEHFRPLKAGPGRTHGYRMSTPGKLDELRGRGDAVWTTRRYDAQYVIDVPALRGLLDTGRIPVLHLAEPAALDQLRARLPDVVWRAVVLVCPRDVAERRIRARATGDADARLAAYDAFREPDQVDLRIDTAALGPDQAAAAIADNPAPTRPGDPRDPRHP